MTGDEAYHAECFRCVQCESKIDDLVFAKTSQGIYCMKCHKERKEAKRQREERERMERAERMMEKLLPTIQEAEHQTSSASKPLGSPQQNGHRSGDTGLSPNDMSKSPIKAVPSGSPSATEESRSQTTGTDHRPKQGSNGVASVDTGPPFLPPLAFGMDDPVSSEFDLEEMLSGSEKDDKSSAASSPGLPTSPTMEEDSSNDQDRSAYRVSVSRFSARLSASLLNGASFGDGNGHLSELTQSPPSSSVEDELDNLNAAEAIALVRELRMELAKHHPSNPLLNGTPQREYGLLLEKTEQLTQKHAQLEASMRDMYIEKDLLGMDIEAMNEELKAKESALASNGSGKLGALPANPNPRMSTNHEFMKQAYQGEVKALQEQKERLQLEIQAFVEQRDSVLDEMQVLSVRNAELSTINNDMMREMQGRGSKSTPAAAAASGSMLSSFTGKMRKTRHASGGNQEPKSGPPVAGSGDSTLSFTSHHSDEARSQHGVASRSRRDEVQEDIFGEEQVIPKKFNWKKGTMNTMNSGVKNVGAMFGKLLVEAPSNTLEVPGSRNGHMYSDNGSSNGQVLPPTSRSGSSSSDTRSFNGRFPEQHFFVQYNYLKPTRCECCEDKIWGREYRCRGCGFQVHGRCSHEVSSGCSGKLKDSDSSSARNVTPSGGSSHGFPSSPSASPSPGRPVMFGNNLLDQLEQEQRAIPMVVERCIEAVDERGLDVEGIYRRSGVLKQYLRSLPEPLVPYDMYGDLMEAIGMPQTDSKTEAFRELLDRMPYAHYATLKTLLEHLNRVTERESINLMTPKNLSVVFGPTLMRNPDPSREILDTTYKNMTIEYLILNTSDLFVRTDKSAPTTTTGSAILDPPGSASSINDASGVPVGFTGQRQGSLGRQGQLSPPPRRVAGHASGPTLPPRSSSGDGTPVINHTQPTLSNINSSINNINSIINSSIQITHINSSITTNSSNINISNTHPTSNNNRSSIVLRLTSHRSIKRSSS
ncbi:hypothetical protein BGZ68_001943 [Mortierella alpina]|nr:hypothetical protein BGZ68_001943 [Mortierella alpina]